MDYKLYTYTHKIENEPVGTKTPTTMQYITDASDNVLYYNLNNSGWNRGSGIELMLDDPELIFERTLSREEVENDLFLDIV